MAELFRTGTQSQEDYPLTAVPMTDRKTLFSTASVLLGFTFFTGTMFGGGTVGVSFDFTSMLGILLAGNLLLGAYAAILGIIAYRSGLSTVLLAKHAFGSYGSKWVDFVLGFTQMGWYAWGTAMVAKVLNTIAGVPEQYNWVLILVFGIAFSTTAFIGYRGLEILSRFAVPAMLILIAWSMTIATRDAGGLAGLMGITPKESLPVGVAITIIFGTFASGGTQSTNWTRYAKTAQIAALGALAAFFVGNGLMSLAGAYGALVYQDFDLVVVMSMQGLLLAAVLLLMLNVWTTQDNTIYNFSVAGCAMFNTPKRRLFVVAGCLISVVLAFGGIYEMLIPYLILLGTFIPPIGGVIMADYWFRRQNGYAEQSEQQFNWAGIIAYVGASLAAKYSPGIAALNGILAAIVLYWILNMVMGAGSGAQRKAA
jgi:cytosine permease